MRTPEVRNWYLKSECDKKQLAKTLSADFQVEAEAEANTEVVTLMDDFDWAIWNANSLLLRSDKNTWRLYSGDDVIQAGDVKKNARFWWELPESTLRDRLRSLISLRAAMPVVDVQLNQTSLVLRNNDDKIVVRITLTFLTDITQQNQQDQPARSSRFIQIKSLRGYQGAFSAVIKLLAPYLTEELGELSTMTVMQLHGYGSADHDELFEKYGITKDEPVEQAIRQMSLLMLHEARHNEQGVIDDIDTEFLHHYRVSLRKTRSLLNLMKKALPTEIHLQLKTKLAELARATNMLRDLDVFLLEKDYYQAMLPENFSQGLTRLFKLIAVDREKARKSVQRNFLSAKHARTFDEVVKLLEAEPLYESEMSKQPVFQVAKKKILNRYGRIRQLGAAIHDGTPDEEVHQLRIECKKLRYLMEFFAELFPKKRIKMLIKSLKKLQVILGNFNDYSVQKEFLAEYERNHEKTAQLSAAINGLIAVLHQKQVSERQQVQQAFTAFNDQRIADEFRVLFGKQKVGNK